MYNRYFGLYLLSNGFITKEHFFDLTDSESTPEEIAALSDSDEKFRHTPLFTLLSDILPFKQPLDFNFLLALLEKNIMLPQTLKEAIIRYQEECRLVQDEHHDLKSLDYEVIVRVLLDFSAASLTSGRTTLFYEYIAMLLRSIVRLLDEGPAIWTTYETSEVHPSAADQAAWTISQSVIFKHRVLHTRLIIDDALCPSLVEKYIKEPVGDNTELIADSLCEFLNVSNGLWAANLSNAGASVDLSLVEAVHEAQYGTPAGYVIPIGLLNGQIRLVLSYE